MQQTIYIAGALMLLGLMSLSLKDTLLKNDENTYNNLAIVTAKTLAHSVIQDISTRQFDRNTASGISDSTLFTPTSELGCDAGESPSNTKTFNDIDDYKSLDILVPTKFGDMRVRCNAYYVTDTNPNTASSTQTFFKRVDVKVTSPFINITPDSSLTLGRVYAYRG